MSNNNIEFDENNENLENNSAFEQDDNSTTYVKESFFDRVKEMLTRKRIGPANNVQTTNMGFTSWSIRATFRKALESVSNGISNIMKSKEPEVTNGFATTVIGRDDQTQSKEVLQEKTADPTVTRIIPPIKVANKTVAQVQPKGIINNSKTAKDVAEEKEEISGTSLKLEEMEVDNEELTQNKEARQTPPSPTIEVADLNVATVKEETSVDERDDY
jgi:hypothetical protein